MRSYTHRTPSTTRGKGFSFASHVPLVVALATALLIVACQQPAATPAAATASAQPTPGATSAETLTPTASPSPTPQVTVSPSATTAATASPFPVTIIDDEGTSITLATPPDKVVSLTPATTELIFALGAGERLVGRTDYDDYPPQVRQVPAVATYQGVEMEKVVKIRPDLVLAGGNGFTPPADIKHMRDLGIPVLVLYASDVAGVLADIRLVGQAVDQPAAADSITTSMQAQMDQVTQAVSADARPKVFYEIGNDPELYGPAPGSFVADMVTLAGGDAITTTDPAVFSIPVERLVSLDPDVIVLGDAAYGVCPDQVKNRPGWSSMTAVKEGNVRPVDDTIVTRPGPRLGDGLMALALAIHPDAPLTEPADAVAYCTGPSPS